MARRPSVRLDLALDALNEWALVFSGVLSVIFGILLLVQPGAGALALAWLIGLYAVIFGIAMLVFAWRLRGLAQHISNFSVTPV
jgi:uncharacterized membrane protein HdeD (DUF308 family)